MGASPSVPLCRPPPPRQGHYTANNPTGGMSIGLELLTAAIHSLAFELLYRGVAVTLLSRWLCDRFYEAGAEEALALPAWLLMGDASINTPEAAQWSAATIMVLISTVSVLRKVSFEGGYQPSQREASFEISPTARCSRVLAFPLIAVHDILVRS